MRRVNDILAISILILTAVLLAALGLKAYHTYVESEELERQEEEQAYTRKFMPAMKRLIQESRRCWQRFRS